MVLRYTHMYTYIYILLNISRKKSPSAVDKECGEKETNEQYILHST